ncbi:hypothetical protein PHYBLDRAFT_148177 [Phycomyces blakesleeanus NRRL 1555(-)]|uniref:Uncharacterized protein n=1 Tax=Phycomyces blakesleeanus (strain ATCC 8743b / DSM 1359 / FGSC 10004 / NBRC 33097 / NRRL 1555) TaxID=763407 RepID=A0A167LRS5_PHYB8|nr:hypothetical protein PHYBLDRAFT_148177 [Phycomyces blakesleeanus NRRL 1555(-)]OAD70959.1 hypothetical protein PHYBLDRAFT_148177 [Phycomyces blakesleeanus NRRL 1555(-)]|eukprot:XP_018288999.1 hypothetical protein PHYBLDRAFT_148177 [Phycomyces blakesleeanus NRRL 1555(-)]
MKNTPHNTFITTEYLFHRPRANLVTIGNSIASPRKYIPILFHDSPDNVFAKINVVPYLPNRTAKTVALSLVKCCAIALQWTLTSELLDEIESFLYQQDQTNTPYRSVLRLVQHYPVPIPSVQLREPFHRFGHLNDLNDDSMEGVSGPSVKGALLKYYQKNTGLAGHEFGDSAVIVVARLWMDSTITNRKMIQKYIPHNSHGSLHFHVFVEAMKEHDAPAHASSVPIVKQRSQNITTSR